MTDTSLRYSAKQGLYYRKPYITRKCVAGIICGLIVGNFLGCFLFSFKWSIPLVSLGIAIAVIFVKKVTDGRMAIREADSETCITFEQTQIKIEYTFSAEPVEKFHCTVCDSDDKTRVQTYLIPYENIQHVFWYDNCFVLVVGYPCGDGSYVDSDSGVISPLSISCPLAYYDAANAQIYSRLRKHPQNANLDYILSYINAIR